MSARHKHEPQHRPRHGLILTHSPLCQHEGVVGRVVLVHAGAVDLAVLVGEAVGADTAHTQQCLVEVRENGRARDRLEPLQLARVAHIDVLSAVTWGSGGWGERKTSNDTERSDATICYDAGLIIRRR